MTDNMTKKQHYVPQFYLKNFIGVDGKLCVYDRKEDSYFKCDPQKICYEEYLYETKFENADPRWGKFIQNNVIEKKIAENEGKYSALLKKIINICGKPENRNALVCNSEEKRTLASFVTNMLLRNPWSIKQMSLARRRIKDNKDIAVESIVKNCHLGSMDSVVNAADMRIWLDENINNGSPQNLIKEFLNMNFWILYSERLQFVTSSFPVIYETYDSLDCMTHMNFTIMPINSRLALYYSTNKYVRDKTNHICRIDLHAAESINKKYLGYNIEKNRFIISETDRFYNDQKGS